MLWALGQFFNNVLHFFDLGVIGKHGRKYLGGTLDRPQKIAFETMKGAKKNIINAINVNVLIGESQISHLLRAYLCWHYRT
jgi:hypothetical protein